MVVHYSMGVWGAFPVDICMGCALVLGDLSYCGHTYSMGCALVLVDIRMGG